MSVYNDLRLALWDMTDAGVKRRGELTKALAVGKVACGAAIAGSIALVAIGVFAMISSPVGGGLVALTGAFLGVYSRDGLVVSENLERIINKTVGAAKASINEEQMAADILQDTWFAARIFTSILVVGLKEKK